MNLLKQLWGKEPVLVTGIASLAVALGLLSSTDATAIEDGIAAVADVVATLVARSQVKPHKQ